MHFLLYALIGILSFLPSVKAKSQHSEIDDAIALLLSLGVPEDNFCSVSGDDLLPSCITAAAATTTFDLSWMVRSRRERYLQEEGEMMEEEDTWFLITHALCALACVTVAALAAGLTMGLLSLDPLMLLIKLRAGSEEEKQQAASILPIVKQHHLLLVTLLLLNSIANEALPLFLVRTRIFSSCCNAAFDPNTTHLRILPGSPSFPGCSSRPLCYSCSIWRRDYPLCNLHRTQQDQTSQSDDTRCQICHVRFMAHCLSNFEGLRSCVAR